MDPAFKARLSPVERRRAGRVAEALQSAEFAAPDIKKIVRALFDGATEADLRAAFAVFDKDGEGSLDAEEFREMMPLLAGHEALSFAKLEALFREADKDRSGMLEYTEFVWLIASLNATAAAANETMAADSNQSFAVGKSFVAGKSFNTGRPNGGRSFTSAGAQSFTGSAGSFMRVDGRAGGGGVGHRYIKSVDELRADRLREAQQGALAERAARLRSKADLLSRACGLLHQERGTLRLRLG